MGAGEEHRGVEVAVGVGGYEGGEGGDVLGGVEAGRQVWRSFGGGDAGCYGADEGDEGGCHGEVLGGWWCGLWEVEWEGVMLELLYIATCEITGSDGRMQVHGRKGMLH